jgi:RND family efflux transporter MFP subunit
VARHVWILLAVASGCSDGDSAPRQEGRDENAPAVEIVRARSGSVPLEMRFGGVVRAQNQVVIRAEIEAPIRQVFVRNGDAVQRGTPLVQLAGEEASDQVRQAEASVRLAEAQLVETRARVEQLEAQAARARSLGERELLSQAELEVQTADLAAAKAGAEQSAARVEQSRALLEERRRLLAKTVVRAPVAGRVGARNAEVGLLASPSTPLFVIGDLSALIVEVPLTERALGLVREGNPVRITSSTAPGEPVTAALSRISPFLSAGSFSTTAEIDLANPEGRLHPGMFVQVDVLYGESEPATLVPLSAIWEDPKTRLHGVHTAAWTESAVEGADSLLSVHAFETTFRPVEIVAEGQTVVGVRGVSAGDWVVTVGRHLLGAGTSRARVRPMSWERVLDLEARQREDLIRTFLDKQQHIARTQGAVPPTSEAYLRGTSNAVRPKAAERAKATSP